LTKRAQQAKRPDPSDVADGLGAMSPGRRASRTRNTSPFVPRRQRALNPIDQAVKGKGVQIGDISLLTSIKTAAQTGVLSFLVENRLASRTPVDVSANGVVFHR
jgi:hypothetical protein